MSYVDNTINLFIFNTVNRQSLRPWPEPKEILGTFIPYALLHQALFIITNGKYEITLKGCCTKTCKNGYIVRWCYFTAWNHACREKWSKKGMVHDFKPYTMEHGGSDPSFYRRSYRRSLSAGVWSPRGVLTRTCPHTYLYAYGEQVF